MKLAEAFLDNKTAAYACVLLVLIFGSITLNQLPIQLTPEVTKPEITITTGWRAANPEEIESEIIEPQENALKGLPGVTQMVTDSTQGRGTVRLTFALGISIERAMIEVVNRLNSVPSYPADVDNPVLSNVGEASRPIAWFIIRPMAGNDADITRYNRFLEETVQRRFERIPGVSLSEVRGAMDTELLITIDAYRAAARNIILPEIAQRIAGMQNISAGDHDIGKRSYSIRYRGKYTPDKLQEMVLVWRDGKAVRLRDIATVTITPKEKNTFVITKDGISLAVNAYRESGVNVIEVMNQLQQAAQELREGPLQRAQLTMEQVYDETDYIREAITLLFSNLLIGILLAGLTMWWFTRRLRALWVVSISVPMSLFAALVVLELAGRTLNTISLAALALSVGMVLDASIIVVENILRLRSQGQPMLKAAIGGVVETRMALVASVATTVAIFLPILWLGGEVGQLFTDLAVALSAAIVMSLFTALFLVPSFSNLWLGSHEINDPFKQVWGRWSRKLTVLTDTPKRRFQLITALIAIPILITVFAIPKADYLPAGNRNLVFAILLPPPGMNIETMQTEVGEVIAKNLTPYVNGDLFPKIKHYFFVAFSGGAFMGARAQNADDADAVVPVLNNLLQDFPGMLAFAQKASLFSDRNSRSIELNIQGNDIEGMLQAARMGYGLISKELPGARVRPRPGLELSNPQLTLIPNEDRIVEAGWDRGAVGMIVRAAGDGLYTTDYFDGQKKLDVIVRIDGWETPEGLGALPFATPNSGAIPLEELVSIERRAGPDKIRRLNRLRTITLEITAPQTLSLQETLSVIETKIVPVLRTQLPPESFITYSGSADKLLTVLVGMAGVFALAIVILYLLISVLFRSFRDGLLIIIALPLATFGSVLMLRFVNLFVFQPLDLLTMIGFIIMLGLVVNNAILLVNQTRVAERNGMHRAVAVEQALLTRLRPIAISTLTSLLGMMPLLLSPGPGSELYRGLAAVIIGGLAVSTLFTLVLLPALLRLGEKPT